MPEIEHYGPGRAPDLVQTGDFLLVEGASWVSPIIRLFDGSRFTHAAMVWAEYAHEAPDLVEALAGGVRHTPLSDYDSASYVLVRIEAAERDRKQMARFLESVVHAKHSYDYLRFVSVGLANATGGRLTFGMAGSSICSALCAEALCRNGAIFFRPPASITPAQLANAYKVI